MSALLTEGGDRVLLESGVDTLGTEEVDVPVGPPPDPPPPPGPGYWRGEAWIGDPRVNVPSDGALR